MNRLFLALAFVLTVSIAPSTSQAIMLDGSLDYYSVPDNFHMNATVHCWDNNFLTNFELHKASYLVRSSDDQSEYILYVLYYTHGMSGQNDWIAFHFNVNDLYPHTNSYRLQFAESIDLDYWPGDF